MRSDARKREAAPSEAGALTETEREAVNWLESDEAAEVVASHARNVVGGCICGEKNIEEPFAKHVLAALAAHAKGEADG